MSSPEADFAWQGGSWIPQATWSEQTLLLPTSSVTLGLQWKEPNVMLNPDRFLYGKDESSISLVLDAASGQLSPLSLLLGFTVLCVQSSSQGSLFTVSLGHLDSSQF